MRPFIASPPVSLRSPPRREASVREHENLMLHGISYGYSLRHIITEALIHYCDNGDHNEEVKILLDQLRDLLQKMEYQKKDLY